MPSPYAELHPLLADRIGVVEGAAVRLTTARGSLSVPARVTDRIRPDTVFVPFHWARPGTASTASPTTPPTPLSGMPEFKVCAVDVTAAALASPGQRGGRAMTRIVVVGNGMVGSRFVEELLSADRAGRFEITVLGAESCEPYNRVLLSEVVAGRYDLAGLRLPTAASPRLTVHLGYGRRTHRP